MPVMAGGMTSVSVSSAQQAEARRVRIQQQRDDHAQHELDGERDGEVDERDRQGLPEPGIGKQGRPVLPSDVDETPLERRVLVKAQPDVVDQRIDGEGDQHRDEGREPGRRAVRRHPSAQSRGCGDHGLLRCLRSLARAPMLRIRRPTLSSFRPWPSSSRRGARAPSRPAGRRRPPEARSWQTPGACVRSRRRSAAPGHRSAG